MAKKGKTAKHRKQRRKELANRKAKLEQRQAVEEPIVPEPDTPPMSPARRAFQDV